jgi:hypothetical protein
MLGWSGVYVKEGTRILFYVLSSEVMFGASLEGLKSGTCVFVLCKTLAIPWHRLSPAPQHVQIELFQKFIFMVQDLYQFDQQLELYTTYLSIFENA